MPLVHPPARVARRSRLSASPRSASPLSASGRSALAPLGGGHVGLPLRGAVPACSPWRAHVSVLARIGAVALLLATAGCTPSIGDKCASSTDCSISGDRQCDVAQPGGYCTVLNCVANGCPSGSGCVAFQLSVPGCAYDDRGLARTARSFCLVNCSEDGDCRAGYVCASPLARGAALLDTDQGQKVCIPPASRVESTGPEPAVCKPGAPVPFPPFDAGPVLDGAVPPDGGVASDSGAGTDSGAPVDAGTPEGGPQGADAGDAGG